MKVLGDAYGYSDIDKENMANYTGDYQLYQNQLPQQQLSTDLFKKMEYERLLLELDRDRKIAEFKKNQLQKNLTTKTKEKHMFGFAKEYLEKHKDTAMTVLVALFIDHFFLGGALREKIKGITEGILDSAQKKLSHTPNAESKDATKNAA